MVNEQPKQGFSEEDIAKALENITDPGERAVKAQRLRQIGKVLNEVNEGKINAEELGKKVGPLLDASE